MNNNEEEKRALDVARKKAFLKNVDFIKEFNQERYKLKHLNWKQRNKILMKKYYYEYDLTKEEFNILDNIVNSYYHRLRRCRAYIEYMFISGQCFFITMTFNDKILNHTKEKSRKEYIKSFCKNFDYYVANIDYGKKNEREHYHAVCCLKPCNIGKIEILKQIYEIKYGFIYIEPIRYNKSDRERVSKYINKLTNHAFKDTTIAKRLIYSKNKFIYLPVHVSSIINLDTSIEFVSYETDPIGLLLFEPKPKNNEFFYKYILGE